MRDADPDAFTAACAVPPAPAQGADGWVARLPESVGDGARKVEMRIDAVHAHRGRHPVTHEERHAVTNEEMRGGHRERRSSPALVNPPAADRAESVAPEACRGKRRNQGG